MGRAILRGGKIAVVTITVIAAVVGCALYWSGVFTSAEVVEVVQEPEVVVGEEQGRLPGAAELAAFERVVDEYTGAGRESDLEALCENAIRYAPGSEQDLVARQALTGLYIRKREADSAAGAIEEMVALFGEHPRIARALCETGDAYRKMRQFAEAEQCYRNVVEQFGDNPYSIWSQKDLCTLYVQTGDAGARDAAVDELVVRYAEHPELPLAICGVGDEAAAVRKDYEKARGLYQYVAANFASNPQAIWAQKNLCRLLVERIGDSDAAQAETDRLMQDFADNPNVPAAVLEVADAWRNKDYIVEARGLYERIVADYPESEQAVWSQKNICTICAGKQDIAGLDGALGRLTVEFGERKGAPAAMCGIGDACAEAGLFDKAEQIYKHVVGAYAGDESVLWARKDLCLLRMRMGDAAGAAGVAGLRAEFASDERLPQALCEIADVYRELGRRDEATGIYGEIRRRYPADNYALWATQNLIGMQIEDDAGSDDAAGESVAQILDAIDGMIGDFRGYGGVTIAVCRLGEQYYNAARTNEREGMRDKRDVGFRKAIPIFAKVMGGTPFDAVFTPDAYYMSAVAYSRLGDYAKAIELHRTIVDNWASHHLAWSSQYWTGAFYQELKKKGAMSVEEADAKSEEAFLRLFADYPGSGATYQGKQQLGMMYFKGRRWEEALGVFEEIVGASPPGGVMPKEGYYLAQVYEKIGQAEMALQTYREFIKGREETGWAKNIDAAIARLGGGE